MPQADCRSVVVINELPMIYFDDLSGFLARNRRHNVATYLTALSYEAIERTFGATATEVLHDQLENFITSSITVESSIRFCHKVRSGYIQPFYITQLKPFAWMGASVPRRRDVQVELPSREYYGFLPAGEETFSSGREM